MQYGRTRKDNNYTYRRLKNSPSWHFCRNCSRWPTSKYEQSSKPTGDLCRECRSKSQRGECIPIHDRRRRERRSGKRETPDRRHR